MASGTILITAMGSSGSLNLVDTLRLFDREGSYRVIGTNWCPYELARAELDDLFVVPGPEHPEAHFQAHQAIIERFGVDLLIANKDREVGVFAERREQIACRHFLPDHQQVSAIQDKLELNRILMRHGCRVVANAPIASIDDLDAAFRALPPSERYWVRQRHGDGAQAAAAVNSVEQARQWLQLWCGLHDGDAHDFVLAPFLPGRDIAVAVLFQDGEFSVGKAYERVHYMHGEYTLSGVGPMPRTGVTVSERAPIDAAVEAVKAVSAEFGSKPHGIYYCDEKCGAQEQPYVTEINVGRFHMTSPHYDRVGRYNLFELYLSLAFDPERTLPRNYYDFDPGKVFVRGVDHPLKIVDLRRIQGFERIAAQVGATAG